ARHVFRHGRLFRRKNLEEIRGLRSDRLYHHLIFKLRNGGAQTMLRHLDSFGHFISRRFVAAEIEIEFSAQEPFGESPQSVKRILDRVSEELASEHVVVDRDAESELQLRMEIVVEKVEVVSPAGEEELPLQIGKLDELRAAVLFKPRVFKRH